MTVAVCVVVNILNICLVLVTMAVVCVLSWVMMCCCMSVVFAVSADVVYDVVLVEFFVVMRVLLLRCRLLSGERMVISLRRRLLSALLVVGFLVLVLLILFRFSLLMRVRPFLLRLMVVSRLCRLRWGVCLLRLFG